MKFSKIDEALNHRINKSTIITAITTALVLFFLNCNRKQDCHCTPSLQNDSLIHTKLPAYDSFLAARFDEKLLSESGNMTIRFSISGAFTTYTKIYRIEQNGDNYNLLTKVFQQGNNPKKDSLIEAHSKGLREDQIKPILKILNDSCFWTTQTPSHGIYLDASTWRLEVYDPDGNPCTDENRHIVVRWSPQNNWFRSVCDKIIELDPIKQNIN
jgi:hypothetical protein